MGGEGSGEGGANEFRRKPKPQRSVLRTCVFLPVDTRVK